MWPASDEALVAGLAAGDPRSATAFVRRFQARVYGLALSMVGKRDFSGAIETGRRALQHFYEAGDVSGVTLSLDDLALSALGSGDAERAGRLWGAARSLQQRTGTGLADYVEQMQLLFGVPTPKDALPPDDLARLAAEGARMSLDEIVAYSIEMTEASAPSAPLGNEEVAG